MDKTKICIIHSIGCGWDGESIDDNRLPTDKGQHKSDGRHIYIYISECVFVCVVYA